MTAAAERLGRYTLVRLLGTGGMGELYLARADGIAGFAKLVALKRIVAHKATNERLVRMLLNEARLVASLQHPNIAQVYDVGVENGEYFFAMEYVHGHDLRHVLHRAPGRRLALENSLHIAIGLCAGLHHAHEARDASGESLGIVHRDVSPGNVLVSYDGAVKLVDFGVAKASTLVPETREGVVKGKYGYMSPEQCLGAPLDRRSDLFAVGIMLWEMTVGRRLFKIQGELATLQRVVYVDAPRPSRYATEFPRELEHIIMRALARDPEKRYATAQELQIDLEELAVQQRLAVSAVTMSREMSELFKDRIDAWREAERAGRSLADHLAEVAPDDAVDSEELDGVIGDLHTNVFSPGEESAGPPLAPLGVPGLPLATPSVPPLAAPARRSRRAAVIAILLVVGIAAAVLAFMLGPPNGGPAAARMEEPASVVMSAHPADQEVEAAPASATEAAPVATPEATPEPELSPTVPEIDAGAEDTAETASEPVRTHDERSHKRRPTRAKPKPDRSSRAKSRAETKQVVATPHTPESPTEPPESPGAASATTPSPPSADAISPKPAASPKPAGPGPGTVDATAVRAVVKLHLAEIQACVSRARMEDRDLKGRVTMRIELAASGTVTETSVASSTGATPGLESCMRKAVATWTFPAPAGGVPAAIRYPFAF